jgi:hypothetical protein
MCRRVKVEPELIRFLDDPEPRPAPSPAPAVPKPPGAPGPSARPRREWPVGWIAFLAVFGTGVALRTAGVALPVSHSVTEDVAQVFSVSRTPQVVVETFNGAIEVARGEPDRVDCVVTKRASAADEEAALAALSRIDVAMINDHGTIKVAAHNRAGALAQAGASVLLHVPAGTAVTLRTRNGPIAVQEVEGPVDARSSNGRIGVRAGRGPLKLATTNGRIDCAADHAVVAAESSNGEIDFRGALAAGPSSFYSRNGRVTLRLPRDLPFRLDARASNGKVSSDFDFPGRRDTKTKQLVGAVGHDPEVTVKVRTHNGKIRILSEGD